jgi:uncharacterized membrane protein
MVSPLITFIGYFTLSCILLALSVIVLFFIGYIVRGKKYRGKVKGVPEEARFVSSLSYLLSGYLLSTPVLIFAPLILIGISEARFVFALSYLFVIPLSIILPLIIYSPRKDNFVTFHSLQSATLIIVFLSFSSLVVILATYITLITQGYGIVVAVPILAFIGILYLLVILLDIWAGWKSFKGEEYKIFFIGSFCHRIAYKEE